MVFQLLPRRRRSALLLAVLCCLPAAARADGEAPAGATLTVLGRPIITFRETLVGLSPSARLRRAEAQIARFLLDPNRPLAVSVTSEGQRLAVLVDGELAFVVTPADVDSPDDSALGPAAEAAAEALRLALRERREASSLPALGEAAVGAGLGLLLLVVALWVLGQLRRLLNRALEPITHASERRLKLGGAALLSGDGLRDAVQVLANVPFWLGAALAIYEWLGWTLRRFPVTRAWGEQLQDSLVSAFFDLLQGVAGAVPNLAVAIVIFFAARLVLSALRPFFDNAEQGGVSLTWLDADTARPTRRLVTLGVWAFALAMAYPYLPGANTAAFQGLSVLVGLMASLGASSVVGQAAAGLILMYTRTLRAGEYVRIGEHEGTVIELGTFATRIRTGQGEELALPNNLVASSVTLNLSRPVKGKGYLVDTSITIGYDTPWRQVEALLLLAARRTAGVVDEPPPRVFQVSLSDFYVEYRLVAHAIPADPAPRAQLLSALHAHVLDVFNEHGVQITSPHYLMDPPTPKVVPRDGWYEAPAVAPGTAPEGDLPPRPAGQ